jgi:hypothetical protein
MEEVSRSALKTSGKQVSMSRKTIERGSTTLEEINVGF